MSVSSQKKTTTTTYRTVNVASPEPVTSTVISAAPVSPLPYGMNGSYETVRYLVPMQQAIQQPSYILMQQPMVQQMVSPVYLHSMPHLSVSSQESTDLMYQQQSTVESISGKSSSVFSQSSSPIKSPEPSAEEEEEEEVEEEEEEEDVEEEEDGETVEVEEVEVVNVIQQRAAPPPAIEKISRTEVRTEVREVPQPAKMDTRYFGELLADVYRKNCDIHSCISEHVSKIRGKKHQLDPSNDYKVEREEVEALLPKGATELTKQQIRYLLQTRLTADKSMRLLLSTFSSLREELLHMSEDLRRLESEKEGLERDLSFKADQAKQYDCLLEAVRENNRQLQVSLKETTATQRSLESQLLSSKNNDSSRDFKIKEMEGRMRALEKENEMLRQKNQITKITTTTTTSERSSSEKSLQLKISELLAMLEQRQTTITRQEEVFDLL